jgi:ferredoxin
MFMVALKVQVDESFCDGIGYCARLCSEVFQVDPATGKAVVLKSVVDDPAIMEQVEQAETTCPTRAIMFTRVDG